MKFGAIPALLALVSSVSAFQIPSKNVAPAESRREWLETIAQSTLVAATVTTVPSPARASGGATAGKYT